MKKIIYFFVLYAHLSLSSVEAEELPPPAFIQKVLPHLPPKEQEKVASLYGKLATISPRKIKLDKEFVMDKGQLTSQTFGYTHPPRQSTLGPLLQHLSSLSDIFMLDIGPGHGYSILFAMLSGHVRKVVAVDVSRPQQEEMRQTLAGHLSADLCAQVLYLKRDFSKPKPTPKEYLGKFPVVHLGNVLHFLNIEQTTTMIGNIASMMASKGRLFITTIHFESSDPVFGLYREQQKAGLKHPELVYFSQSEKDYIKSGEFHPISIALLPQDQSAIPDPSYMATDATDNVIQGRHIHTPEGLRRHLSPFFNIVSQDTISKGAVSKSRFLLTIAERKE